jgi:hypothetical protein
MSLPSSHRAAPEKSHPQITQIPRTRPAYPAHTDDACALATDATAWAVPVQDRRNLRNLRMAAVW